MRAASPSPFWQSDLSNVRRIEPSRGVIENGWSDTPGSAELSAFMFGDEIRQVWVLPPLTFGWFVAMAAYRAPTQGPASTGW